MPTILLRRGTTAEREAYTPDEGEIIFDTTYTGQQRGSFTINKLAMYWNFQAKNKNLGQDTRLLH